MQWYAMVGQEPGMKTPYGQQVDKLLKEYDGWSREVIELLEITTEENVTQRDL